MKRTHRIFSALLALIFVFSLAPMMDAHAETAGVLTYTVSGDQVTITDCDTSAEGELVIPDTIDGYPVTCIGNQAFYSCKSLTGITIPDSVTRIEGYAFAYCNSLTGITMGDSVTGIGDYAVAFCSRLTSITIPGSVTSIGDHAFDGCKSLTGITIPDSVTSIGKYAFYTCTSLTGVTIQDGVISIGNEAFSCCNSLASITIPGSVTKIGTNVFYSCDSLTGIWVSKNNSAYCSDSYGVLFNKDKSTLLAVPVVLLGSYQIPNSVTSIGDWAFQNCSLTSVTIPNSVTRIGGNAFTYCNNLTSITIPNSVTSIGYYAFGGCGNLTGITIPDSVTSIGNVAFKNCASLTSITIPNSVTSIGSRVFSSCTSLTSITIPDSVTSIGDSAFENCTALGDVYYQGTEEQWNAITVENGNENLLNADITFNWTGSGDHTEIIASGACGDNLTWTLNDAGQLTISGTGDMYDYLYEDLMSWAQDIQTVVIENGVTGIGRAAFADCTSLTSVTMGDSVTNIGNHAFANCTALGDVFYQGTEAQWNAITVGIGNEHLLNADITFNWTASDDNAGNIASGTCGDNLTWVLDASGQLIISGTGAMWDYSSDDLQAWIPNIKSVVIENGVTSIGGTAFAACGSLTSVTIGDSVTSIGRAAFADCRSLTSVTMGASVTSIGDDAFKHCTSLTGIIIPDRVTRIGHRAFGGCTSLTSITIPGRVNSIGNLAFVNCDSLTGIWVNKNNTAYSSDAYGVLFNKDKTTLVQAPGDLSGRYPVPVEVTSVGDFAFGNCDRLNSIHFSGSAPTFEGKLDGAYIHRVCYPAGDASWTENVRASAGAKLTWVAWQGERYTSDRNATCTQDGTKTGTCETCGAVVTVSDVGSATGHVFENGSCVHGCNTPALQFCGATLKLEENLTILFMVSGGYFTTAGYENPYVVFELEGAKTTVDTYTISGDNYVFAFEDIAPQQMNDLVYATVYATCNGTVYASGAQKYSVSTYCYNTLARTTNAKLRTLLVDLLNYGVASQLYTGYKTDELVNAKLTEEQKAWGTQTERTLSSVTNAAYTQIDAPSVNWKGVGLKLTEAVEMYFVIEAEDTSNLSVAVSDGKKVIETISGSNVEAAGNGLYYVYFSGLNAGQMSQDVYLTVYEGTNPVSNTLRYSIESYVYKYQSGNTKLANLVKAMMKYGDSANAYVN